MEAAEEVVAVDTAEEVAVVVVVEAAVEAAEAVAVVTVEVAHPLEVAAEAVGVDTDANLVIPVTIIGKNYLKLRMMPRNNESNQSIEYTHIILL